MSLKACITLDLEPDHAGLASERYDGWRFKRVKKLLSIFKKHMVNLTVFVVGKSLKKKAKVINLFQDYGVEFQLHSFSHNLNKKSSFIEEIEKGKEAFIEFFAHPPLGYRAPAGRITKKDWEILEKLNFNFDASVFPSFWPKPQYLFLPNRPFKVGGLWEIPFSVTSSLKIPLTLSYMKLIGWKIYKRILDKYQLPNIIVFGCHLHDFWRLPVYKELPLFWKLVYSKNPETGFLILEEFLTFLKKEGYSFITVGELVKILEES